jgi:GNAT superfamily N-acetyltransferase
MEVKRIGATDTHPIRNRVLRPGRPVQTCIFDGDEDELTFHLGAFVESKLVSIASFYYDKNDKIDVEHQFRLRGMATLPEYQHQGLSSALLKTAIPLIKQNHCHVLWCNARTSAKGFYETVGFETVDPVEFEIPDVGPHLLMAYSIK